jgi:two-component system, LytTR family, response regulator
MSFGQPFSVIIADDDPIIRRDVVRTIQKDAELCVAGEAIDGEQALSMIAEVSPDLVILDVQMPGLSGFEIVTRLPTERIPRLIFLTAYQEHAVRAFDLSAVDFVLKPYDSERLELALARAKAAVRTVTASEWEQRVATLLNLMASGASRPLQPADDRVAIRVGRDIVFVKDTEIDWVNAERDYMRIHSGKRSFLAHGTMARMEQRLPSNRFLRIHRSVIVALDRIAKIERKEQLTVILCDGTRLGVGESYQARLLKMVGQLEV